MADQILGLNSRPCAEIDLSSGWIMDLPLTKTCVWCPATKVGRFTVVELPPHFSVYPAPQAPSSAITPSQAAAVPLPASSDDYDTDSSSDYSDPPATPHLKMFSIFSKKPTPVQPSMNRASKPRFKSRKLQARVDSAGPNLQKQACIRQFLARQCDGPIKEKQA